MLAMHSCLKGPARLVKLDLQIVSKHASTHIQNPIISKCCLSLVILTISIALPLSGCMFLQKHVTLVASLEIFA